MITKPPPYDSAPTLNATQASAATPPLVLAPAASNGQGAAPITCPLSDAPRRRSPSSISPQARRTSTTHGPAVAAERPPRAAYTTQRLRTWARPQLAGTRLV